jgi:hypothetical protein
VWDVTKRAARTVANLVLVSAGVAAAYVVYTTPPLRRLAGMASRRWLGASIPIFLLTQARRAWVESGAAGAAVSSRRAS